VPGFCIADDKSLFFRADDDSIFQEWKWLSIDTLKVNKAGSNSKDLLKLTIAQTLADNLTSRPPCSDKPIILQFENRVTLQAAKQDMEERLLLAKQAFGNLQANIAQGEHSGLSPASPKTPRTPSQRKSVSAPTPAIVPPFMEEAGTCTAPGQEKATGSAARTTGTSAAVATNMDSKKELITKPSPPPSPTKRGSVKNSLHKDTSSAAAVNSSPKVTRSSVDRPSTARGKPSPVSPASCASKSAGEKTSVPQKKDAPQNSKGISDDSSTSKMTESRISNAPVFNISIPDGSPAGAHGSEKGGTQTSDRWDNTKKSLLLALEALLILFAGASVTTVIFMTAVESGDGTLVVESTTSTSPGSQTHASQPSSGSPPITGGPTAGVQRTPEESTCACETMLALARSVKNRY
jgi:hypothetical protein